MSENPPPTPAAPDPRNHGDGARHHGDGARNHGDGNRPPEGAPGDRGAGPDDHARGKLLAVRHEVGKAVVGQESAVMGLIIGLIARGHVLLEGVPGTAKTLLVRSLAAALAVDTKRVQFTPDLMPGDITGSLVYDPHSGDFSFRAGPVFTHLLLADEINRTPPKTQAALLEAMEERQVSVDGQPHKLPPPFLVAATQNPVEYEGTYPLPEAQRDRFMARISMGYPSARSELEMLDTHGGSSPLDTLRPVTDGATVSAMILAVRRVRTTSALKQYIVDLAQATRTSRAIRLGASPRAALHLLRASRAHAALAGRDHVLPDDVQAVTVPVLAHRLILTGETHMARRSPAEVLTDLLDRVRVPAPTR